MRNILLVVIFVFFFSCKNEKNNKALKKANFYPYTKKFDGDISFAKDVNFLVEKQDSLSDIHFLKFEKDSFRFLTKRVKLPSFRKGYLKLKDGFILLNTRPRTLGKNLKSTDFLTKYDESFKVLLKKDMDISRYPSGKSFILGGDNKKFYVNELFSVTSKKDTRNLIVSEIDDSFIIKKQKVLTNKKGHGYKYSPVKSIFIENIGIVVVSDLSDFRGKQTLFRIQMFDLDLNEKWSQDLNIDKVFSLGYSKSENKIFLLTKNDKSKLQFWDYLGNKLPFDYVLDDRFRSIAYTDNSIYIFSQGKERDSIAEVNFSGELVKKSAISQNTSEGADILFYENNQLFLMNINNFEKLLTLNKLDFK